MAFLRTRTASPDVPTADAVVSAGLTSAQIDGNFKSLDASKAEVNQTMFIGTTSVAINRGTGALSLTDVSIDGNAGTATTLQNARTINGTSFNGSANITTSTWGTARNVTIGAAAAKSVNGSADVSWTLNEIGAAATNQTMHIGTTSVAINRVSANLSLNGIIGIYTDTATGTTNSQSITISTGSNISTSPGTPGTLTLTAGASPTAQRAGSVNIRGGSNGSGAGPALGGNVSITGGVTTSSNAIEKTSGSIYIDGGGLAANGTQTYGSVFIGNQANNTVTGTAHVTIGKTGTEVRLPGVGTSGFVKLSAGGTLIADTNTYWNTNAGSLVDIYDAGVDDLNNWAISGFYYLAAGSLNAPTSNEQIVYAAYPSIKTAQISVDASQNGVYTRVYDGNTATWSGWNKLLSTADIAVEDGNSNLQLNSLGVGTTPSTVAGEINASGKITALEFNGVSDAKYKTNVEVIQNGLDIISQINPVSFNWISNDKKSYGVIAQELEKVIPEAVSTTESGDKTVNYMMIIAFLVSAVQQLSHKQ